MNVTYQPTRESLSQHEPPGWFLDAKFGLFVHWGPYSIPAFAPLPGSVEGVEGELPGGMKYNPYVEWYLNTLQFEDSPTAIFHRETYGQDYAYDNFGVAFNEALNRWNPDDWADRFKAAGARYVVLVTKHHDGFLLWPSKTPNPHKANWHATRDVVGELAEAVRARGMRFGVYYSGGIDWTFRHDRLERMADFFAAMPGDREGYTAYANAHYEELIERYRPDYLWNDIGYPDMQAYWNLLALYYNTVAEGLTNDRWMSPVEAMQLTADDLVPPEGIEGLIPAKPSVFDSRTPEYGRVDRVLPFLWEVTRGMTHGFAHNRNDNEDTTMTGAEVAEMISRATCFGGNVLLNVAIMANTEIEPLQAKRLEQTGAWLKQCGDAIFDTRPVQLDIREVGGVTVGATQGADRTFVHLLGMPAEQSLGLHWSEAVERVELPGGRIHDWRHDDGWLRIDIARWSDDPVQIIQVVRGDAGMTTA